jgi:enamine deaminase RidA (YjgF/YER057c/UK114 family)
VKLSNTQSTVGSFIPVVITGNLAFVSGQIPIEPGSSPVQMNYKGKMGRDISLEEGRAAARVCIMNGLSELKQALGSLDKIKKFVKVSGYVNCVCCFNCDGLEIFIQVITINGIDRAKPTLGPAISVYPFCFCFQSMAH